MQSYINFYICTINYIFVFPVSTPLSMKDKGPDGSGKIRLFFEKVWSRPTQLLRGEKDEPDMCGLNRPTNGICPSHRYPRLSLVQFHGISLYIIHLSLKSLNLPSQESNLDILHQKLRCFFSLAKT